MEKLERQGRARRLARRMLCWVGKEMKGRDEGKRPPLSTSCGCDFYCSQKLGELVKNGNCSYPVGEEGGTTRRGELLPLTSTTT